MKTSYSKKVYFSGHVQQVGFRAQTLQLAKNYPITGFVKNLDDGRVYLEAEGPKNQVNQFIEAISNLMKSHIKTIESSEEIKQAPEFKTFTITY
jgi:acylphosphatase